MKDCENCKRKVREEERMRYLDQKVISFFTAIAISAATAILICWIVLK